MLDFRVELRKDMLMRRPLIAPLDDDPRPRPGSYVMQPRFSTLRPSWPSRLSSSSLISPGNEDARSTVAADDERCARTLFCNVNGKRNCMCVCVYVTAFL